VMWDERDNSLRFNSQTNLFVKGIPQNVKAREFYEFFLTFGDVVSSKMPEDDEGNQLGYGYINYYDPESAKKAIQETETKEIWGAKLQVELFQKKNERVSSFPLTNCNVYIKNFPSTWTEVDLRSICTKFGEIVFCKIMKDNFSRNFGIVSFKSENCALEAKAGLNEKFIDDNNTLYVDTLMTKQERKKIIQDKIIDSSYRLNEQYKFCNLHVKNIPYQATEEELTEEFEKYGEIKSVKIDKYMLVTKENNEFKEIPTSRGFGYVCFEKPEAAKLAKESMTGKFLQKYQTWNRPLIIDYFMPKHERKSYNNTTSNYDQNKMNLMYNPMMNQNIQNFQNMNIHPGVMNTMMMQNNPKNRQNNFQQQQQQQLNQQPQSNQQFQPQLNQQQMNQPQKNQKSQNKQNQEKDDIDYGILNSLEDDNSRKDYLGEFIFKRIENHHLSQSYNFTIDNIGKITGMILGIEDMNEIIDICKNNDNLTSRISEAMELLGYVGKK